MESPSIHAPGALTPCVNESNGSANQVSDSTVTAEINLVSSVVVPSQKGRLVRAVMSPVIPGNNELLFEPSSDVLEAYGVIARESLVIGNDGFVCIPIENHNGVTACLDSGIKLGAVHTFKLPTGGSANQPVCVTASVQSLLPSHMASPVSRIATTGVKLLSPARDTSITHSPQRLEKLLSVLKLPVDSLSPEGLKALESVVSEYQDVFALDDSELGCTDVVIHDIDTGDSSLSSSSLIVLRLSVVLP